MNKIPHLTKYSANQSITDDQIDDILHLIAHGGFMGDAAMRHGITHAALMDRLAVDGAFAERLTKARAQRWLIDAEHTQQIHQVLQDIRASMTIPQTSPESHF